MHEILGSMGSNLNTSAQFIFNVCERMHSGKFTNTLKGFESGKVNCMYKVSDMPLLS